MACPGERQWDQAWRARASGCGARREQSRCAAHTTVSPGCQRTHIPIGLLLTARAHSTNRCVAGGCSYPNGVCTSGGCSCNCGFGGPACTTALNIVPLSPIPSLVAYYYGSDIGQPSVGGRRVDRVNVLQLDCPPCSTPRSGLCRANFLATKPQFSSSLATRAAVRGHCLHGPIVELRCAVATMLRCGHCVSHALNDAPMQTRISRCACPRARRRSTSPRATRAPASSTVRAAAVPAIRDMFFPPVVARESGRPLARRSSESPPHNTHDPHPRRSRALPALQLLRDGPGRGPVGSRTARPERRRGLRPRLLHHPIPALAARHRQNLLRHGGGPRIQRRPLHPVRGRPGGFAENPRRLWN
jgi:hypothetical protein